MYVCLAGQGAAVVAVNHPISIQHRHQLNHKVITQDFRVERWPYPKKGTRKRKKKKEKHNDLRVERRACQLLAPKLLRP